MDALIALGQSRMGTFLTPPSEALASAVIGDVKVAELALRSFRYFAALSKCKVEGVEDCFNGGEWKKIDDAVGVILGGWRSGGKSLRWQRTFQDRGIHWLN
jgi:hypothetical protein